MKSITVSSTMSPGVKVDPSVNRNYTEPPLNKRTSANYEKEPRGSFFAKGSCGYGPDF